MPRDPDFEPDLFQQEYACTPVQQVRCISLWQPWASLMAAAKTGGKFIETRGKDTGVRGLVYIHAAKTLDGLEDCRRIDPRYVEAMEKVLGIPFDQWARRLPFQKLIARGKLAETLPAHAALARYPGQEPFGNFGPGRFGHLYEDLEPIEPIHYRGAQGFFFADIPA